MATSNNNNSSEPYSLKLARNVEAQKMLNTCSKVVSDGKAFRNHRLQKKQRNVIDKQHEFESGETEENGKYKFFRFANNNLTKPKQPRKPPLLKTIKDSGEGSIVENESECISNEGQIKKKKNLNDSTKITSELESEKKANVKTDKTTENDISQETKSKGGKKVNKNKKVKFNENDNSHSEIVDAMESILKDNEKFRSTPFKLKKPKQAPKEDNKKFGDISTDIYKIPKKKAGWKPITNTKVGSLEKKILSMLKQSKLEKIIEDPPACDVKPKPNILSTTKNELAKTLFGGQSWIEGNKALKENTNNMVQFQNSNLESVLSKEIIFKTNNVKARKPVASAPQQISKGEIKAIVSSKSVEQQSNTVINKHSEEPNTTPTKENTNLNNDSNNYVPPTEQPLKTTTFTECNSSVTNIERSEIFKEMNLTSTFNSFSKINISKKESVIKTAAEKPLDNLIKKTQCITSKKNTELRSNSAPSKYFDNCVKSNTLISVSNLQTNTQRPLEYIENDCLKSKTSLDCTIQTNAEIPLKYPDQNYLQSNPSSTSSIQKLKKVPSKYFKQNYLQSNSSTLSFSKPQTPAAEPNLKLNEDSFVSPEILAEPNLKINKKSQETLYAMATTKSSDYSSKKQETNPVINVNKKQLKQDATDAKPNQSQFNLKASEGTTEIPLKPITKTIKVLNPLLNEKPMEMKVKIFTDPNSKKSPEKFDPNNIRINLNSTEALQCYKVDDTSSTKACIQYSSIAQKALSALTDEVSSALRESFSSIENIWHRVRHTIDEINESSRQYNNQQKEKISNFVSQSTPQLPQSRPSKSCEFKNADLLHALSLGLVQTQSENQVRLAVMPTIEDSTIEIPPTKHVSDLQMPPLAMPDTNMPIQEQLYESVDPPILPRLIPVIETFDQPCTVLKQQKRGVFNIPPPVLDPDKVKNEPLNVKLNSKECVVKKPESAAIKALHRPSTPVSKFHPKRFNRDLPVELKQKIKEIALGLGLDELPRMRAQQNIHARLLKEFDAADSLIEFQRQMKQANEAALLEAKLAKDLQTSKEVRKDDQSQNQNKKNKQQSAQITAEELYVPAKMINKIASTNLNSASKSMLLRNKTPKCQCQFLYRERKKRRERHCSAHNTKTKKDLDYLSSNTSQGSTKKPLSQIDNTLPQKYPDSLWFSNGKKKTKISKERSSTPVSATNSSAVVCKCSDHSTSDVTAAQVQADKANYILHRNISQLVNYKTGLDCFDILDEISLKDLKPLESEYPRKDHMGSEVFCPKVENTYLYKLVYGSAQDQLLRLLKVEEPSLYCQAPDCQLCSNASKKDCNITANNDLNDAENKTKPSKVKQRKTRNNNSSASSSHSNLLQNKSAFYDENKEGKAIIVNNKNRKRRSISTDNTHLSWVSADNKRLTNNKQRVRSKNNKTKKFTQDDVIAKLRPYMFDPRMRYPTTITVMPVSITTTYANPHFTQNYHKNRSGDYTSEQPNTDKYHTKSEHKDKTYNKTAATKPTLSRQSYDKKSWNNKCPKSTSNNLYLEGKNQNDYNYTYNVNQENPIPEKIPRRNPVHSAQQLHSHLAAQHTRTSQPSQQAQKSSFINHPPTPPTHTFFVPAPQLRTSSAHAKTAKVSPLPIKPPAKSPKRAQSPTPKIQTPRLKTENLNVEKGFPKQSLGKKSLETNIQNVIDMIEGKIVDIVSSPDQTHSETFDNVEKEIVNILKTIQSQQTKPLDSIEEQDTSDKKSTCSDRAKKKEDEKKKKKTKRGKCQSKTTSNLNKTEINLKKNILHSETFPYLIKHKQDNDNVGSDSSRTSTQDSNEEHFTVTSSCSPSGIKTPESNDSSKKFELHAIKNKGLTNNDAAKATIEIPTDQFLTPFMRNLKKYRQRNTPLNVLEFLDTLSNITKEASLRIMSSSRTTIYYQHNIHIAHVFHNSEAFYPVTIYHTVLQYNRDTAKLSIAGKLFSYMNPSKFLRCRNKPFSIKRNQSETGELVCCHVDKVLLESQALLQKDHIGLKVTGQLNQAHTESTKYNETTRTRVNSDEQYSTLLNSFYGILFTAIFFSLSFNYTCQ